MVAPQKAKPHPACREKCFYELVVRAVASIPILHHRNSPGMEFEFWWVPFSNALARTTIINQPRWTVHWDSSKARVLGPTNKRVQTKFRVVFPADGPEIWHSQISSVWRSETGTWIDLHVLHMTEKQWVDEWFVWNFDRNFSDWTFVLSRIKIHTLFRMKIYFQLITANPLGSTPLEQTLQGIIKRTNSSPLARPQHPWPELFIRITNYKSNLPTVSGEETGEKYNL